MIKNYKKYILGSTLIAISSFNYLFFLPAVNAGAKDDYEQQMQITGTTAWGTLPERETLATIIQYVISGFLSLLGIIFIVLIIYAGFNWMTAQGDETKTKKAVGLIRDAIIGLGITIAANIITYWVMYNLTKSIGS